MTDTDGFRLEAATQLGAQTDADCVIYTFEEGQLIAFAKACERKGRAEAMQMLRSVINNPLHTPQMKSVAHGVFGQLKKINSATDAELAPLLEAERQRCLAKQDAPLCVDEGCPQHGTLHICVERTGGQ